MEIWKYGKKKTVFQMLIKFLADLENIFIISKLKLETINNKLSSLDISLTTAYFLFTRGAILAVIVW